MSEKIRAKLDRLIALTEEFGFDVGMHNKCFDEALQKRVKRFGEDSEDFAVQTLGLIETRLRYLKEKSKWWYKERPEHLNNAMRWKDIIESRQNREEFEDADLGTILSVRRSGKFAGRDFALKTSSGWAKIVDIVTTKEIFNTGLTGEMWDVDTELLPRFDSISMVYEGFDGENPRHVTDLKALPVGTKVQTPSNVYVKTQPEVWTLNGPDGGEFEDHFFSDVLRDKQVKVV